MKKVLIVVLLVALGAAVAFASLRSNSKKSVPEKKVEKKETIKQ